jgi:hypothetical protein
MYKEKKIHKTKPTKKSKQHKSKNKTKKGQLFSDDNPETTVHGYGFQNAKIAQYTIDDLKYRDIDYQFQVVNTMYYRGQEVIKRTKDKTRLQNIKNSLDIFFNWLSNYKQLNLGKTQSFPYMTYKQIKTLEFLAEFYDISHKARGLQKPTKSDKGFIPVWKEVKSDKKLLRNYPIKESIPQGQTWDKHRNFFIVRRLSMIKNAKDVLYYTTGPFTGLPTKLHVNMMMWGYSPDAKSLLSNIKKYRSIVDNYNK